MAPIYQVTDRLHEGRAFRFRVMRLRPPFRRGWRSWGHKANWSRTLHVR